ncbi:MAG TPA: excinuclease ABC subunit C [Rhodospirillaceae bacterium]|nr:excinuclease ABC subunit C [Rhodospirillaceae bacterium]
MKYVYILQSEVEPERFYTGTTDNLQRRLKEHNAGESIHTNKHKPWKIKTYIAFENHEKADDFEAFLKTGNGRIFCKKRL